MTAGDFVQTVEGKTTLLVPPLSLTERVPPKTPAFFNPAAKLNRDLSILAYRAFAPEFARKSWKPLKIMLDQTAQCRL